MTDTLLACGPVQPRPWPGTQQIDFVGRDIWFWSSCPLRIEFFREGVRIVTAGVPACGTLQVSHAKVPFDRVQITNFDPYYPADVHMSVL